MPTDLDPVRPPRAVRSGLPVRWRFVFAVEIPICLLTCLLWLFTPGEYLDGLLGRPHDTADYLLLQQSTAVVLSMFVYFYARVLFGRRVDLRTFRHLQEAMALGDVFVLGASWAAHAYLNPRPALLITQTAMAAIWLSIRVLFLVRVPAAAGGPS